MSVRKKIKRPPHRRVVDARLLKTLKHVVLFRGLSVAVLSKLLAKSEVKTFQKDQFIFHAGQVSDGSYVNLQGVLRIENNGIFLSKVDEGETVGEMGVLNDLPRSADLLAMTETKVLFIPKQHLYRIMKNNQKTAVTIYKNAVWILGTLIRNKNIVMEFIKILDNSVLASLASEDLSHLRPNVE